MSSWEEFNEGLDDRFTVSTSLTDTKESLPDGRELNVSMVLERYLGGAPLNEESETGGVSFSMEFLSWMLGEPCSMVDDVTFADDEKSGSRVVMLLLSPICCWMNSSKSTADEPSCRKRVRYN